MFAIKSACIRASVLAFLSTSVVVACSDDSDQPGTDAGTVDSSTSSADAASADGARTDDDAATPTTAGDAATPSDAPSTLTCSQKLANPTAGGSCAPSDETKPCSQGCLTCRCSAGQWQPCTTDPSCMGG